MCDIDTLNHILKYTLTNACLRDNNDDKSIEWSIV